MSNLMEDTKAFYLPNWRKTCWFYCHKEKHALKEILSDSLTSDQVYSEWLDGVNPAKASICDGNGHEKNKFRYGKYHNWHKESIFCELSYWWDLILRHNLDVMHIEYIFRQHHEYSMNLKGEWKDTIKSRLDNLWSVTLTWWWSSSISSLYIGRR